MTLVQEAPESDGLITDDDTGLDDPGVFRGIVACAVPGLLLWVVALWLGATALGLLR